MDVCGIDGVHETDERRLEDESKSRLLVRQRKSLRCVLTRDFCLDCGGRAKDFLEEGVRGSQENVELFLWNGILILLDEALRVVGDIKGVMTYCE